MLPAFGQPVSRTQYSELFAEIGTRWGVGDGSTSFNVPEMRNQVPVGVSSGIAALDTLAEALQLGGGTSGVFARVLMPLVVWTVTYSEMKERERSGRA